jgi:hypothetical protein
VKKPLAMIQYREVRPGRLIFHPAFMHLSVNLGLSEHLMAVLAPDSSAIVVSSRGQVLALLGHANRWHQSVPARASLYLALLAQAADQLQGPALGTTPADLFSSWGLSRAEQAWKRLGLNRSALALSPRPTQDPKAVVTLTSYQVNAPLASIADAYLPFIAQGRITELSLVGPGQPGHAVVSPTTVDTLSQVLPRLRIKGLSFTLWRPLGQNITVAWPSQHPKWLLVSYGLSPTHVAQALSITARQT